MFGSGFIVLGFIGLRVYTELRVFRAMGFIAKFFINLGV